MGDILSTTKYCTHQHQFSGSYYCITARCIRDCRKFPCEDFSEAELNEIEASDRIEKIGVSLKARRKKMFLFLYKDGTTKEAYKGFDPKDPDWSKMGDVQEVYPIKQVLVPQMKLVVKPKQVQQEAAPKPKPKTTRKKKT